MMCKPCKRAGRQMPYWLTAIGHQQSEAYTDMVALHKKCKHPTTCPCQHKIEDAIQQEYR